MGGAFALMINQEFSKMIPNRQMRGKRRTGKKLKRKPGASLCKFDSESPLMIPYSKKSKKMTKASVTATMSVFCN